MLPGGPSFVNFMFYNLCPHLYPVYKQFSLQLHNSRSPVVTVVPDLVLNVA